MRRTIQSKQGRFLTVLVLALCLLQGISQAQLTDADQAKLIQTIEKATNQLDPARLPSLEGSKAAMATQIAAVEPYISKRGDEEIVRGWMQYLDLEPISELIQSGDDLALGRKAIDLRYRLIGTAPGLEMKAIQDLRRATESLINALRFRDADRSMALVQRQLQNLNERIGNLDRSPSASDMASISAVASLLNDSNQAPTVVKQLHDQFSQPNIAISISEPLVERFVEQHVEETRPVCDCILGTKLVGTATMVGNVEADILPSDNGARMQVALAGTVTSDNTGYNGPVCLCTVGHAEVEVTRQANLTDDGIQLERSVAHAKLETTITSINHPKEFVRKIARKRAAKQKPKADRIATQKMKHQLASQFTERTDAALSGGAPDALADVRNILQRLSLPKPTTQWTSTDSAMTAVSTFRREDQMASLVTPPALDESYDLAIQVHESLINNALSPVFAGRTLTEAKLNQLLEDAGRALPESQDEDPPFEIDFARIQPIVFQAREQTIRVGVRGTRFAQGRRELKRAMEISAAYQVKKNEEGQLTLVREGEIQVDFPGNGRLTVAQAGLKPAIQKKFGRVFPNTLLDKPLEIPEDADVVALRGHVFQALLVDADNGWLSIGIR